MFSEFRSEAQVVGTHVSHASPERGRMIKHSEVTELVDYNVVHKWWRERRYDVVKVQVPFPRAAAPARTRGAYCDSLVRKAVVLVKLSKAREYGASRGLLVSYVMRTPRDTRAAPYPPSNKAYGKHYSKSKRLVGAMMVRGSVFHASDTSA